MKEHLWNRFVSALLLAAVAILTTIPVDVMADSATEFAAAPEQDDSQVQSQMTSHGDYGAVSLAGEAGFRNFRGSGTYGVYFTPCQRFKVTGEYLTQNLEYHFGSAGGMRKWVSQYAVGGEYQSLIDGSAFQSVNLGVAYSHAFSQELSDEHPTPLCTVKRHIAGSNGFSSFLGTSVSLWRCAFLTGEIDYDWVNYDRKFQSDKSVHGFGGSLKFVQQFAKEFSLNLGVELRRPYFAYLGSLNWNRLFTRWGISWGIFGNITDGNRGVPNIATGGIQLGLSFGGKGTKCCRSDSDSQDCYERAYCNVSEWVSTPAVYVPIVLAISDNRQRCVAPTPCVPPTSTTIPDQTVNCDTNPGPTLSVPLAPFFTSSLPLTFSMTHSLITDPRNEISLDPNTGVITFTLVGVPDTEDVTVTVTGTSSCGSTSQTFVVHFTGC